MKDYSDPDFEKSLLSFTDVDEFCKHINITKKQFYGEEIILDSLTISDVKSIPDNFAPIVEHSLSIPFLELQPKNFSPTTGTDTSIPLRKFAKIQIDDSSQEVNRYGIYLTNNKKFVFADGEVFLFISKKDDVYKGKSIRSKRIFYIAEKNGRAFIGKTVKEAKLGDEIYYVKSRDTSRFKNLCLTSRISFRKAIEMYIVITNKCGLDVRHFVNHRLKVRKAYYTVHEFINLTKNEYGSKPFETFFSLTLAKNNF